MNRSGIGIAALASAVLFLMAGCDQIGVGVTPIGEIQQQSAAFEGKDVTIRGISGQAIKIPLVDTKYYRLKDATGEMAILTNAAVPADGEEVIVRGRVENALIVDGRGMGMVVREQERKSAWMKTSSK